MKHSTRLWAIFLAILLVSGCKLAQDIEDLEPIVYEGDWALPIMVGKVVSNDLFAFEPDAGEFFVDSTGRWAFRFDSVLQEIELIDVLDIPDIPFPLIDSINQVPFPSQEIRFFDLNGGSLVYEIDLQQSTDRFRITLRLPEATLQGAIFEETFEVQGPGVVLDSFSLAGYEFNLSGGVIDLDYSARNLNSGQPSLIPNFVVDFANLDLEYALGDFSTLDPTQVNGKVNIPLPETLNEVDDYRVGDPSATLSIINSVGTAVRVTGNQLDVVSTQGVVTSILTPELQQGALIDYPPFSDIGSSRTTDISINASNSLLPEALSNFPEEIDYDFTISAESVQPPDTLGFVSSTSSVGIEAEFIVPIDGAIVGHLYTDTAALQGGNLDGFERLVITLESSNGFPFEVEAQGYFILDNGVVLDSLYESGGVLFGPAEVDQNGEVIQPFELVSETEVSSETLDNMRRADAFVGFFTFETTDAQNRNVVIKDGYQLDYQIRLDAFISFTTD